MSRVDIPEDYEGWSLRKVGLEEGRDFSVV